MDFVGEGRAVDGGAASAGAGGVAALDHEAGDYSVEDGVGVVAAGDEGGEVLAGLEGVRGLFSKDEEGGYLGGMLLVELDLDNALGTQSDCEARTETLKVYHRRIQLNECV